ncbi:hypothetical protein SRB5_49940 [Streptomyces sp. RB5]|uniref:AG2 protein n=1 Tax=Streptomyces smaragdinus TaxID=2585196 RepID=A0A7K0CMV4_9ACTN|nr:hypothetical protein [Streptomyces smaragdinus]MQY14818.1 hypothetical protein [Streptomyces smaragdinus]
MVTYQHLTSADFEPLADSITAWQKLPDRFKSRERALREQVKRPLAPPAWQGESSDAAHHRIDAVGRELTLAAGEASDVHSLLLDAHTVLTALQKQLRNYVASLSDDPNLTVDPSTGHVSYTPKNTADLTPTALGLQAKNYAESITSANADIAKILTAATEADDNLRSGLERDANGRGKGFSDDGYNTLGAAEAGREQAEKDAAAATALAGIHDRPLTETELRRLNTLMQRHEGDPDFAERFALSMGPKRTLEFWARASMSADKATTDELTKLQKSFGVTLATATQSNTPAMERWERDMTALGKERISLQGAKVPGTLPPGPYGFQVMSSLMRNGRYESDFLQDYGKELLKFERASADKGITPENLWRTPAGPGDRLTFGIHDTGTDPMSGYLEALGQDPTAATAMFDDGSSSDPDLKYLLEDRKWPVDWTGGGDPRGMGHDELGHALEAATLGVPHGEVGLERTAEGARVMTQVVKAVAVDDEFLGSRPGMNDSIARMSAGYIDDFNWALADRGGNSDHMDKDLMFGHEGLAHLQVNGDTAQRFLKIVAEDEVGHATLTASQSAFTHNAMLGHLDDHEMAKRIMTTGSYMHGYMDESRIAEVKETYAGQAERINAEIAETAAWKKYGTSQVIGVGAGFVAGAAAGPGAGVVVATAVPMAIEAGAGALDQFVGAKIDESVPPVDFSQEASLYTQGRLSAGLDAAKDPALWYADAGGYSDEATGELVDAAANCYEHGAGAVDRINIQ